MFLRVLTKSFLCFCLFYFALLYFEFYCIICGQQLPTHLAPSINNAVFPSELLFHSLIFEYIFLLNMRVNASINTLCPKNKTTAIVYIQFPQNK